MLKRLRKWMITKLAGNLPIAINLTIKNGAIHLDESQFFDLVMVNVSISYCEEAVKVDGKA